MCKVIRGSGSAERRSGPISSSLHLRKRCAATNKQTTTAVSTARCPSAREAPHVYRLSEALLGESSAHKAYESYAITKSNPVRTKNSRARRCRGSSSQALPVELRTRTRKERRRHPTARARCRVAASRASLSSPLAVHRPLPPTSCSLFYGMHDTFRSRCFL